MILAGPVIHAIAHIQNTGKPPPSICIKHMDKHTATHTCTYDTHVDRMKDGKSRTLNKKSCGLVQPELYPSVSNVVFLSSGGIQKKQQKISFFKQNKSLGKEEEGGGQASRPKLLSVAWQSWTRNLLCGFLAQSLLFKISLDLRSGKAKEGRGIAVQLKAHYPLSPAPCWVEKAWLPLVDTSTGC